METGLSLSIVKIPKTGHLIKTIIDLRIKILESVITKGNQDTKKYK